MILSTNQKVTEGSQNNIEDSPKNDASGHSETREPRLASGISLSSAGGRRHCSRILPTRSPGRGREQHLSNAAAGPKKSTEHAPHAFDYESHVEARSKCMSNPTSLLGAELSGAVSVDDDDDDDE